MGSALLFVVSLIVPKTVLKPRSCRGATRHDYSHAANTTGNIGRKCIHGTVVVSRAVVIFLVKMAWQHSIVRQHNVDILKSIARTGFSQTVIQFGSKKVSAKDVRHGTWILATDKLSCLFENGKKPILQRCRQLAIIAQIGDCRHFYSLVKIFGVLGSLFPGPPKPKAAVDAGQVLVHFTVHPRHIGCKAVMNHVGRKTVLKLEMPPGYLCMHSGHGRTGGIKKHDAVFGGCSRTMVG